jgi:heterodisulfide reductase subunit C
MTNSSKRNLSSSNFDNAFQQRLKELSGQNLFTCYQCGKCTAGCPSTAAMDAPPHIIIRLAWLGQEEAIRKLNTCWLCAACLTCDLRCPKGIDISRIMEALRVMMLHRREEPDAVSPESLSDEMLKRIPQQALVAALRKYTK